MNRLSKDQIEEIRQRVETVEGDRWFVSDRTDVSYEYPPGSCDIYTVCMTGGKVYADFIASARQDIPALLDHIAELERKLAEATLILDRAEDVLGNIRFGAINSLYDDVGQFIHEEGDKDDNV